MGRRMEVGGVRKLREMEEGGRVEARGRKKREERQDGLYIWWEGKEWGSEGLRTRGGWMGGVGDHGLIITFFTTVLSCCL